MVQIRTNNNLHLGFIKKKKEESYETFYMYTITALACHVCKDKIVHNTSHTHAKPLQSMNQV